jgi:biotin-(acetyl-CoA carboxylase) ligase
LGGVLSEYVRGHLVVGIGINVANEVPAGAQALGGWDVSTVADLALAGAKRGLEDLVLDEPAGAPAQAAAHEVEAPGAAEGNGSPTTSEAMAASTLGSAGSSRLAYRYAALDLLAGARIVVATAAGEVVGVARGVDELGSLLVLGPSGVEWIMSGTVLSWR